MVNVNVQHLIQTLNNTERDRLEGTIQKIAHLGGDKVSERDLLSALATELVSPPPYTSASSARRPALSGELIHWLQNALVVARLELAQPQIDRTALIRALPRNLITIADEEGLVATKSSATQGRKEMSFRPAPAGRTTQRAIPIGTSPAPTPIPVRRPANPRTHSSMRLHGAAKGATPLPQKMMLRLPPPSVKGPRVLLLLAENANDAHALAAALSAERIPPAPLSTDSEGIAALLWPVLAATSPRGEKYRPLSASAYSIHIVETPHTETPLANAVGKRSSRNTGASIPQCVLVVACDQAEELQQLLKMGGDDQLLISEITKLLPCKCPTASRIHFGALTLALGSAGVSRLIALRLEQFAEQVSRRGVRLTHGERLLRRLSDQWRERPQGGNSVVHLVEHHLKTFVLDKLLAEDSRGACPSAIHIDAASNGRLTCEIR